MIKASISEKKKTAPVVFFTNLRVLEVIHFNSLTSKGQFPLLLSPIVNIFQLLFIVPSTAVHRNVFYVKIVTIQKWEIEFNGKKISLERKKTDNYNYKKKTNLMSVKRSLRLGCGLFSIWIYGLTQIYDNNRIQSNILKTLINTFTEQ